MKPHLRNACLGVLTSISLLLAPQSASGHGQAKGIVLERHNLMVDIRDANKVIRNMARRRMELNKSELKRNAEIIVKASKEMLRMFPDTEASRHGKGSNAKQKIWSDFEQFSRWNERMGARAVELRDASDSVTPALLKSKHQALGKTCAGCHKVFRAKKGH